MTWTALATPAWTAFEHIATNARTRAMGDAFSGMGAGALGLLQNPAGIAWVPRVQAALTYARPYGLEELSTATLGAVLPGRRVSWGGVWWGSGSDLYREHRFYLAGAWRPTPVLTVAGALKYLRVEQRRYGSAGVVAGDVGVLCAPIRTVHVGCAALNLNNPRIGGSASRAPRAFRGGVAWRPDATLTVALDVLKVARQGAAGRFGMEIALHPALALRAGARPDPSVVSGGFGLHLDRWIVDYAVENHAALGVTHQFEVGVEF